MNFDLASSSEISDELGQRLRAHRLAQNLQQAELAARAGISERALRNIERNGPATLDNFIRIAAALGLAGNFDTLFELKPRSIKAMEKASIKRQRASRSQP
ncbi:XRE family transcriptional regulator [Caballeronia arvi]|uniref:XRE family transcriptional regulator n=1 Tax=Caballeronia arvi TaxID=1777135 RepID=A0A158KWQ3_9BURK|nr:helix-turn-helix transcriptional regulator [Caballeronia arvi]SAL85153.1 XRE family transcriptional regulator [Caballeronia arvi]